MNWCVTVGTKTFRNYGKHCKQEVDALPFLLVNLFLFYLFAFSASSKSIASALATPAP